MSSPNISAAMTAAAAAAAGREVSAPASVLVVDDEEAVAAVLARGLSYAGYDVAVAHSGQEALERLAERHFDALLTDIHMPRMRGDEMQRIAREHDPDLAVLLITAANDISTAIECLKDGVFDYMTKPFDLPDVVVRVGKALERRRLTMENRDYQQHLERRVEEQAERLKRTIEATLESLIHALEAKDPNTRNHSARVADLATALAQRVRPRDIEFESRIRVAALFHDIGKIGVPEAILNKQGPLTEDEMAQVKLHPVIGETILNPLLDADTLAIVRSHHEHVNGRGYPDGLAGEEIPLGGRIVAVADAYDAMTSNRPYRPEITRHRVLEIMRDGADRQWDGRAVNALLQLAAEGYLGERFEPQTTVEEAASLAARISAAHDDLAGSFRNGSNNGNRPLAQKPPAALATDEDSTGHSAAAGSQLRPVLFVSGYVDAEAIHRLRRQTEEMLQRGDRQIVLDMHATQTITPSSAQCIYALDLKAQRFGGRIVLRDVPEAIQMEFQSAGVARMLRFERSSLPGAGAGTPVSGGNGRPSTPMPAFIAAAPAVLPVTLPESPPPPPRPSAKAAESSPPARERHEFSDPGFAMEFEEFLRQRRDRE